MLDGMSVRACMRVCVCACVKAECVRPDLTCIVFNSNLI